MAISCVVVRKPFGPHHCSRCRRSVQASNNSSRGASNTRAITISRPELVTTSVAALLAAISLLLALQPFQVAVQPVEVGLPEAAIALHPVGDLPERGGLEPAGPPLRLAS